MATPTSAPGPTPMLRRYRAIRLDRTSSSRYERTSAPMRTATASGESSTRRPIRASMRRSSSGTPAKTSSDVRPHSPSMSCRSPAVSSGDDPTRSSGVGDGAGQQHAPRCDEPLHRVDVEQIGAELERRGRAVRSLRDPHRHVQLDRSRVCVQAVDLEPVDGEQGAGLLVEDEHGLEDGRTAEGRAAA